MSKPPETPLWTAEELVIATGGQWVVSPPANFAPVRVSYDVSNPKMPRHLCIFPNGRSWRRGMAETIAQFPALSAHGIAGGIVDPQQLEWIRARKIPRPAPLLLVPDTRKALTSLCDASRKRFRGKVVALTGTVGKTTSREMIRHMLAAQGGAEATRGNNNNIAGCERTMAYVHRDLGHAVIEMGFGHPIGGISVSAKLVAPHVALITWVDVAHVDVFTEPVTTSDRARELVGEQKLGIVDGLVRDGVLVFNRDNVLWELASAKAKHYRKELLGFGTSSDAAVRLVELARTDTGTRIKVDVAGKLVDTVVEVPGDHMAMNAVGALAVVHALGADVRAAAAELESFKAVGGRAEVVSIKTDDGGSATLINDTFNATPASVRSTLDLLAMEGAKRGGRRVAILGDILHLGAASAEMHASLAEDVRRAGVERLFTTGPMMRHLFDAVPESIRVCHEDDLSRLYSAIRAEIRGGDVITAKSSTPINTLSIGRSLKLGHQVLEVVPPPH